MSKEPCGRNPAVGSSKHDKKKAAAAPVLEPLDVQFIEQPTPSEERDPCKPPVGRPGNNEAERSVHASAAQPARGESAKKIKRPTQHCKAPESSDTNTRESLLEQAFYHGLLSRIDVEHLLRNPGDYLLCTTNIQKGAAEYCLWAKGNDGQVRGFEIRLNDNRKYYMVKDRVRDFTTIVNLVDYYRVRTDPIGEERILLTNAVRRQKWELLHTQILRDVRIGKGAFGEVYKGHLRVGAGSTPLDVAVKTLRSPTPDKLEETMSEARIMRKLDHENIVRFFGVAAEQEPVFVVMELAADGALNDYLKAHGNQLEMRPRLTMLYHAARGLEHVHSKGIIHRDVAARNCLYGNGVLKLGDFGLSREAKEYNIGHDRMPKQWLSPEVFKTQIFTPQADIWAYGVLVWEIFSNGEEPFAGMPLQAIRKQITEKKYRLPMPDWTPKDVKRMVANTWEEDPKKRRPMREIATEMQELAAGWGSGRVLKNNAVKSQKERSAKAVKSRRTSRERDVPSASSKKTAKKRLSSHRGS